MDEYKPDGSSLYYNLILHEVGHALGIGSVWFLQGVKQYYTDEYTGITMNYYIGENAVREYRNYANNQNLVGIPIEDNGDIGLANVHPEEGDQGTFSYNNRNIDGELHIGLDAEIMTGWMEDSDTLTPLSKITIGFLEDLGYSVDYSKADYYNIQPEPQPEPLIPDYSGNFIYNINLNGVEPNNIEQPLYSLNNELVILDISYNTANSITTFNVKYEFYDKNKYDGLHFFKNQNYTFGQNDTINIIQFGNIPLCRYWPQYAEYNVLNYSGSHFENFKGIITATDGPTILNNTSFKWSFKTSSSINQNINHWDISGVDSFEDCFKNSAFNDNISDWNISKATNISGIFFNAYNFNQNLDSWNTENVINFSNMFNNALKFNQNTGHFNFSSCLSDTGQNSMYRFLYNTELTKENYSNILISWKNNIINNNYSVPSSILIETKSHVNIDGLNAQDFFKSNYLWDFKDLGLL